MTRGPVGESWRGRLPCRPGTKDGEGGRYELGVRARSPRSRRLASDTAVMVVRPLPSLRRGKTRGAGSPHTWHIGCSWRDMLRGAIVRNSLVGLVGLVGLVALAVVAPARVARAQQGPPT